MISFATKHDDPQAALGWNERIGFGVGRFGFQMINAVLGSFLTIYFTNVALLDAGIVASIIAVSKVFDGISDLIIGNIVDHTKSKMGKGRVWLFRMCIPYAVSTVLLMFIPQTWPALVKYIYVFLMYNIVNSVFMTFMFVPYFSMISLVTRNGFERGLLGNISEIFSTLGSIVINTFFIAMLTRFSSSAENIYTQQAFTVTNIVVGIAVVLVVMISILCTKERVTDTEMAQAEEKTEKVSTIKSIKALVTNKYWLIMVIAMFVVFFVVIMFSVGAVYYCQYILKDMADFAWMSNSVSIAQMCVMFITPFFMKKFGKRAIYTAGMGIVSLGFLGFGFFGNSQTMMMICNALKGAGIGMAGGMALGMLADTITYGKMKTGVDAVGLGNAAASAAQKLGMGLGTAVFGWVLSMSGFDAVLDQQGLPQPDAVYMSIEAMYTWVPLVLCVLVFIIMLLFFDLEKKMTQMEKGEENEVL
ncbi:MAG: glycoside-pentoside-hexuronide (GPH):cation symporter [Eubacteriales bacterium]|nr:glycoside-pentoside-hexuronide (GPH):cation symporter [Eubacteriales bacterium]